MLIKKDFGGEKSMFWNIKSMILELTKLESFRMLLPLLVSALCSGGCSFLSYCLKEKNCELDRVSLPVRQNRILCNISVNCWNKEAYGPDYEFYFQRFLLVGVLSGKFLSYPKCKSHPLPDSSLGVSQA